MAEDRLFWYGLEGEACDRARRAERTSGRAARLVPPRPPGVRSGAGAWPVASGSCPSPRRPPTSRPSGSPPASRSSCSLADLGYPRFMALDPRGTLLVSVPRAGRVIALPDDNRDGRADAVVPVVEGLELPHGLAFLDGQLYVAETGRVLRFDYDPATRRVAWATDGHRAGPPGPGQPLDPDHRHRARSPALRVRGVLLQQLRGARPPPRGDLPLRRRRPRGRAVRDGAPQRGRDGVPPGSGASSGPPSMAATGSGTTVPPSMSRRIEEGGFYGWPYCHWTAAGPRA